MIKLENEKKQKDILGKLIKQEYKKKQILKNKNKKIKKLSNNKKN